MPAFQYLGRYLWWIPLAVALYGCASGSEAISQTARLLFSHEDETAGAKLNDNLRYLRVTSSGRTVLLVLGYVDWRPEGDVEVWYSGKGEVLRLQNGRIVGTAGIETDWTSVRFRGLPAWTAIGDMVVEFHRERDESPGYRFGIDEALAVRSIAAPTDSLLTGLDPKDLRWFEERGKAGTEALPPSRYAVQFDRGETKATVMYGEQCLSMKFCLAWQRWPSRVIGTAAQ